MFVLFFATPIGDLSTSEFHDTSVIISVRPKGTGETEQHCLWLLRRTRDQPSICTTQRHLFDQLCKAFLPYLFLDMLAFSVKGSTVGM